MRLEKRKKKTICIQSEREWLCFEVYNICLCQERRTKTARNEKEEEDALHIFLSFFFSSLIFLSSSFWRLAAAAKYWRRLRFLRKRDRVLQQQQCLSLGSMTPYVFCLRHPILIYVTCVCVCVALNRTLSLVLEDANSIVVHKLCHMPPELWKTDWVSEWKDSVAAQSGCLYEQAEAE